MTRMLFDANVLFELNVRDFTALGVRVVDPWTA